MYAGQEKAATLAPMLYEPAADDIFIKRANFVIDTTAFSFSDFTQMTKEKIMRDLPKTVERIRGFPLSENDHAEIRAFAQLFSHHRSVFANSRIDEAQTLTDVYYLLTQTPAYANAFPGVCYEAMRGMAAVLRKHGIAQWSYYTTAGDDTMVQNFVGVTLCGVPFFLNMTYGRFRERPDDDLVDAGIVLIPQVLCTAARLRSYTAPYTGKMKADVFRASDGAIAAYTFYSKDHPDEIIIEGNVAHDVTYTLEDAHGERTEIELFPLGSDHPARLLVFSEHPDGTRSCMIGKNKADAAEHKISNVQRITVFRSFAEKGPYLVITVYKTDGTHDSMEFPDRTYSSNKAFFMQEAFPHAVDRYKVPSDTERLLQILAPRAIEVRLLTERFFSFSAEWHTMGVHTLADSDVGQLPVPRDRKSLWLVRDTFPDGEYYIRLFNALAITGRDVRISIAPRRSGDLLSFLFFCDILRRQGACSLTVLLEGTTHGTMLFRNEMYVESLFAMAQGLDLRLFRRVQGRVYRVGRPQSPVFPKNAGKKKVVYFSKEMQKTAQGLAERIKAPTVDLSPGPRRKQEKIIAGLRGDKVIIVHSMYDNKKTEELLLLLPQLYLAGVNNITLSLPYLSYARQDKVFPGISGAAISINALVEYLYHYAPRIMTVTTHNPGKAIDGPVKIGTATVYNLNGFTQLVEYAFSIIVRGLTRDNPAISKNELRSRIIAEFHKHPLYLVGPDQGSALAADDAREVLQKRLWQKFRISTKDVAVKIRFLKKVRSSATDVQTGSVLNKFERVRNHVQFNELGKPKGVPFALDTKGRDGWVFLIDDEISTGGTTLSALYSLVYDIGFSPQRILTLWVHGKFTKGLEPLLHPYTFSFNDIIAGIADGTLDQQARAIPYEEITDHEKRKMLPLFFTTTNSYHSKRGSERKLIDIDPYLYQQYQRISLFRLFSYGYKKDTARDTNDTAALIAA